MFKIILAATVGFLLLAGGAPAFAERDQPGADWMTRAQVTQKLQAAGYTSITGLEADDGHWEGKGVKYGTIMEFHVNPHTGSFTKEAPDTTENPQGFWLGVGFGRRLLHQLANETNPGRAASAWLTNAPSRDLSSL